MPLETTPVPAPFSPSVRPVLPPTARTASIPDQPDADLNRLADRIAELSARIQAATYALLVLIQQFDEQGGWRPGGFSSCAHWLSWRTGLAPGAAREKVRVAHALAKLPLIGAAMLAHDAAAAQGADHPTYVPAGMSSVVRPTAAGRATAIRQPGSDDAAGIGDPQGAAGDSVDSAPTDIVSTGGEHVPAGTRRPTGGSDGSHPDAAARVAHGQAVLEDAGGLRVSAETARRLACDAGRVVMTHGVAGQVLDVGRKTRTIPPALRRALAARDRRCRFPGCTARRCDAHHVRHWAHGGATRLDNLVQLCRRHHRAVHEGGLRVMLDDAGAVRFTRADGRPLPEVPEPPRWTGAALAPVDARLAAAGIAIGPGAAMPAWTGERLDLGWAMRVLWRPRASPAGAASDGPPPPPA